MAVYKNFAVAVIWSNVNKISTATFRATFNVQVICIPGRPSSGAFNFLVFKAFAKSQTQRGQICGKILARSPGSAVVNNSWELL